jgi:hypothetical protein
MDQRDRAAIEDLFQKLAEVERRAPQRDPEAEAFIRGRIGAQPGAPYYMAQTIVAQEQALYEAQRRIEEMAAQAGRRSGGGILDSLFGSGRPQPGPAYRPSSASADYGPWSGAGRGTGGGFLAGAAQTAMGVAGGVVLGNMLADWLSPDEAAAAGLGEESILGGDAGAGEAADAGGFDGGDFDAGDF